MEWFEDWFDTEEYLNVYRHRNEADAKLLVDLILRHVNIPQGSSVLDMACGAGRHSILLAQKNYEVTAVDLSQNLLNVAKRSAEEASVHVNFIRADLRDFISEQKFNLIINLFTSFGYFEEDEENFKIFSNVYDHLTKPGYFVLDYFNAHNIQKNIVKKSEDEIPGGRIIQERSVKEKRVIKKITVSKNGSENNYTESVRMYSKKELTDKLSEIGFDIDFTFGDFYGNTFDLETSQRIIIIARR